MSASSSDISWDWSSSSVSVKILYSVAGVATQLLLHDHLSGENILLDVGDGTIRDLLELPGTPYTTISALVISHGHYDHVGGLFSLLGLLRLINRTRPLNIIRPANIVEIEGIINTFQTTYKDSIPYEIKQIDAKGKVHIGNFGIKAFPVKHRGSIVGKEELPEVPAVGYTITMKNIKIVYSGDTGYFEELAGHIEGANLALIEGTNAEKTTDYHLSIEQAEKLGKKAQEYIIIHKAEYTK